MKLELGAMIDAAKKAAREKPMLFVGGAVAILVGLLFWKLILSVVTAFLLAFAVLAIVIILIAIWLKIKNRQPTLKELFSQKKRLLTEIELAEKKYMKRKLSGEDFNKIFEDAQKELIHLEALIENEYEKQKKELGAELLKVQSKKRHILKSLLDEKAHVVGELRILEKKYLKRKIDAVTYKSLAQKNQERLIEIEARVKTMYDEASVSKIMSDLKSRLFQLEKGKSDKKKSMDNAKKEAILKAKEDQKKKARKEKDLQFKIAKEIADQVSKK